MPMNFLYRLVLLLAFLLFCPALRAQEARVVATVNDEAITSNDVDDRSALIFLSSGLPPSEENKKRVADRVLKNLIDERLQMQEAKRNELDVDKEDVEHALATVAKQNNLEPSQLDAFFRSKGVSKQTLVDQVKSTLVWTKVIQRVLRPQVEVGDDEVAAALERIKANEGKTEYLLSEIFLSVDNPADDEKIRALGEDLVKRMAQGKPFSALAQQFSQGTGSINGGDLGWVQPGQLTGELDRAARGLQVGQVSLPIRMPDGYHIIGKRDERTISAVDEGAIEVFMKQASLPLHGRSLEQAKVDINAFTQSINSCNALTNRASEFPEWSVANLGSKRLGELPRWLAKMAKEQPTGKPGPALQKKDYALLLYVCERNESGSDRTAILNRLGNEKLELQARRLLRDLRRAAAVDVRS